jgi:oligopeptide transport system permease protein
MKFRFIISIWLLVSINFFLIRQLPGTPLDRIDSLSPLVNKQWIQNLGLDLPLTTQYFRYFGKILQGDFGPSTLVPGSSVMELIARHLGATAGLNVLSLLMVFALAAMFVWAQFRNPEGLLKKIFYFLTIAVISAPSLLLAPVMILIFSMYLGWLPSAFLSTPMHYILPCFVLSLRPAVYLARTLGSVMEEEFSKDYVRTARAKGLSRKNIVFKHVLKNSAVPILNSLGPLCVSLLSGSAFVEILFAIPGLGTLFVDSLKERDYFVASALVFFFGTLLIFLSQMFDFLARKVNVQLREEA